MASHIVAFSLNDHTLDRLLAEQKRFKQTRISPDLFAKELLLKLLDNKDLLSKLLSPEEGKMENNSE